MLMQPATPTIHPTVENREVPRLLEAGHHPPQRAEVVDVERLVLPAEAIVREEEEVWARRGEFVECEEVRGAEGADFVVGDVDVASGAEAGGRAGGGAGGGGGGGGDAGFEGEAREEAEFELCIKHGVSWEIGTVKAIIGDGTKRGTR